MTKCAFCKEPTPIEEMVADHIKPLSQGGGNGPDNIQWVHRLCHRRNQKWLWFQWYRFLNWLDSFKSCPKEQRGYHCHHRTMSNGRKECGDE